MSEDRDRNETNQSGERWLSVLRDPSIHEAARRFLGQLFDLQMREIVTTRMLPIVYALAITGAGLATGYSILWGFRQSWWMGLIWLLIAGPALFLVTVTAVRVFLEFVMTVFRIAFYLEALGNHIESIADQTEEIADDLPRIQFWRSRRRER